jgi:hypothetical protein
MWPWVRWQVRFLCAFWGERETWGSDRLERLQLTVSRLALFDQRATDIDLLYI